MYISEFSDVTYLEDLNVAFVKWEEFCRGDDYRNPLLCAIDIMASHPGCNYVADTRDGFENEEDDTRWVFNVFLHRTAATTCQAIFFIIDHDERLKEELEGQSARMREHFDVHYCFGLGEVKAIIEANYR